MKKEYLEAGKIVTTHGIRGEVKIMPYTDVPELLAEFDRLFIGKNKDEVIIERSRVFKNMVIAKIEGVDTPEAAEKLSSIFDFNIQNIRDITTMRPHLQLFKFIPVDHKTDLFNTWNKKINIWKCLFKDDIPSDFARPGIGIHSRQIQ